jgi:cytosine/adenosine deaminase-related metal-dependent hydrolase
LIRYHAPWLLPVAQPPIRNGWVDVEGGRIVAVGSDPAPSTHGVDLGPVALMPGLVNAHTHLELSYLHGRIPPGEAFVDWIRAVVSARRGQPDPRAPLILDAQRDAIAQAVATGTALVGDISNTLVSYGAVADSPLAGVVFQELIRFNAPQPGAVVADAVRQLDALPPADDVRVSLAAHAPYSVAPSVFRAIRAATMAHHSSLLSVHVSESRAEVEFIEHGTGPWRTFLDEVGAWDPAWSAPRATPVQYLDDLGFLQPQTIVVHGVQMTGADLATLKARRCTLVACPRSNAATGAGRPPIDEFYESGVRVAVGTDSLASTADLNMFSELAAMRTVAPKVPARRLLESATRHGAEALGFGADFGTIEAGKRARLVTVRIPPDVADVEEYLVGGINADAVAWLPDEG